MSEVQCSVGGAVEVGGDVDGVQEGRVMCR